MSEIPWDRVKEVFNALAVPQQDRPALLDRLCEGDARLRREVESLLDARTLSMVRTGGAADALADMTTASIADPHAADRVGTTIHRYKLLQLIGEGGFGTVYMAEQTEPVRRKVALKVIKPGMDSRAIIARFEAERQALAMMDHPHIARILDGGMTPLTDSGGGLPYFVMEYVIGDPITTFADAHRLSIADRLAVFQQVCSAVQHAHTKGIIHRDLKPANVIVSMVDDKPFAKVIDFGIAKATGAAGGSLTAKTLFTEHRQLIGTPEYMSPEQAEGSLDIDTRTDVYALGVLLYELLTGSTPIESERLRSAAFDEMRRMIREDEPPSPSLRLSRSLDRLARTAAARKAEPGRLSAMVRGELDWIVMKALEKERARRYETASALAEDVKRHLAGEAVVAAPVSRAYRVRKFVRKNRGAVGAVSAVMLALAAGGSVAAWQWSSYKRLHDRAFTTLSFVAARIMGKEGDLSPEEWKQVQRNWRDHTEEDGTSAHQAIATLANLALGQRDEAVARATQLEAANTSLLTQTEAAEWSAYTANLALAQAALDAGDYPEARKRLADAPESKRGWEWMHTEAQSNVAQFLIPERAYDAAWSRDGKLIATVSGTGQLMLSSGESGRLIESIKADLPYTDRGFSSLDFSRSNHLLACGSWKDVRVFDVQTGERVFTLDSSNNWFTSFLGDDRGVLTASRTDAGRTVVSTFELVTQTVTGSVELGGLIEHAAVDEDSAWLAVVDTKGKLWIVRLSDLMVVGSALVGGNLASISFEKGGQTIAIVDGLGIRRIIDREAPSGFQTEVMGPGATRQNWAIGSAADGTLLIAQHHGRLGVWTNGRSTQRGVLSERFYITGVKNHPDRFRVALLSAPGEWSDSVQGVVVADPDQLIDSVALLNHEERALSVAAVLNASPGGPSGLTITIPDGTRRIVGGADKTVRFFEAKDGKPTLPATAESPEGLYREVAVFRMDDDIVNLQMTGDGTRLIISLASGSARVWDIRDPEERRKDLQAEWAERVPAGAYLDTLWASDTPDDQLRDAVINEASLSPLRRLVAAEMLEERREDDRLAAQQAFEQMKQAAVPAGVTTDATTGATPAADPASITSAVRAAAAAAELPKRVKARVITLAAGWEYKMPGASDAERLAAETAARQMAEAQLTLRTGDMEYPSSARDARLQTAYATLRDRLGPEDASTLEVLNMIANNSVDRTRRRDAIAKLNSRFAQRTEPGGLRTSEQFAEAHQLAEQLVSVGEFERAEEVFHLMGRDLPGLIQEHGGGVLRWTFRYTDNLQSLDAVGYERLAQALRQVKHEELRAHARSLAIGGLYEYARLPLVATDPEWRRSNISILVQELETFARSDADAAAAAALGQLRLGAHALALAELQACLRLRAAQDTPLDLVTLALCRAAIGGADPATLAAAAEIDGKPNSLTDGKVLDREGHRAAAREALAKARALMAPAPDGTPSPWASDEDAKALLAEAEALIEGKAATPAPPSE